MEPIAVFVSFELNKCDLNWIFLNVKYPIIAGLIVSGSAGLISYGIEAREIKVHTARLAAAQVREIEERVALANAEFESTVAPISQAYCSLVCTQPLDQALSLLQRQHRLDRA